MSDLTATNCGCSSSCGNGGFGNSIWLILLLSMCGGTGNSCGGGGGLFNGLSCGGGGDSCEMLMTILLLSCICGGNSGSGCGC